MPGALSLTVDCAAAVTKARLEKRNKQAIFEVLRFRGMDHVLLSNQVEGWPQRNEFSSLRIHGYWLRSLPKTSGGQCKYMLDAKEMHSETVNQINRQARSGMSFSLERLLPDG